MIGHDGAAMQGGRKEASMQSRKCEECGEGETVVQTHRHTEIVGGLKVHDGSCQLPVCSHCGSAVITLAQLAAFERRAAVTVLRSVSNPSGQVMRYARKALGLTQVELSKLIDVAPETLSRIENGSADATLQHRLAVLALLDMVLQQRIDPKDLCRSMSESDGAKELEVTILCPPPEQEGEAA